MRDNKSSIPSACPSPCPYPYCLRLRLRLRLCFAHTPALARALVPEAVPVPTLARLCKKNSTVPPAPCGAGCAHVAPIDRFHPATHRARPPVSPNALTSARS